MQQLVELLGLLAQHRLALIDGALVHEVDGDLHHRAAGALAGACLEDPEAALLHRELDVLHVLEVRLEAVARLEQLAVHDRHRLFERGGAVRYAVDVADGLRRADAGDDILALRVDEELAIEVAVAGRRVARERDTGRAVVAQVAEDHRLHVDGGAPVGRVAVHSAVGNGARVLPRVEDGTDGAPELLPRVIRELDAEALADGALVLTDELAQIVGGQLRIEFDAAGVLLRLEQYVERVILSRGVGLHAEHHIAVHLHEAAV